MDTKLIMEHVPAIPDLPRHEGLPLPSVSETPAATIPAWLAARRVRSARPDDSPKRTPTLESVAPMARGEQRTAATALPIEAAPGSRRESWATHLWHWPRRAAVYGFSTSLCFHLALLLSLTVFVIGGRRIAPATATHVEFGNPGGDTLIDPDLEASLEMEGGHEAAPLQVAEPDPSAAFDAIGVDFGEALEGVVNGIGAGDGRGTGDGTGSGTGTGIGVPAINVPSFAVTKGSFSAWTEPRDPEPRQQYVIVIQVRLPAAVREYRGSDLSGMVIGTDLYKQKIDFKSTDKFPVKDGAVEIRVPVPGANKLVRDTIRIESRMLREKQTLRIEF